MPLPPPPPPGPPPPLTFTPAPAAPEGRNLLLHSIRQGTTLKKTVTNDKSAPVIQGAARPNSSSSSSGGGSPRANGGINGSATLGRNNALAGLFSQGMPKLKPTGLDIGQNNSQSLTSLPSATSIGKPEQTRKQFNVDIKNRGPPPKPPPANLKPTMPQSTSDSVLTGPLHNRSNSTTSLNSNSTWNQPLPKAPPPGGYGKPNVAPKPPGIVTKSPGKLLNGRSVTRAQSMRAPRSPPVAPPQGPLPLLPNQSELYRGAPVFHQSQDSILQTPPPPKHHTLPSPRPAPSRPPLRPPQTRPPPPPPHRLAMSPPPPPPSQAPPPPPHRAPPSLNSAPPPPPSRHSSMRNGVPNTFSSKLEARFAERFHLKEEFPPPPLFKGDPKTYNSRTAKQPAPKPPPHVQLPWPSNSSTC